MHKKIPCQKARDESNPRYHPHSRKNGLSIARNVRLRLRLLKVLNKTHLGKAAPVGNSSFYGNRRKLSAGDLLSLSVHKTLLYTFFAFQYQISETYSNDIISFCQVIFISRSICPPAFFCACLVTAPFSFCVFPPLDPADIP